MVNFYMKFPAYLKKERMPTRRDLVDLSSFKGTYSAPVYIGERKTHIKMPSAFEKVVANRNTIDDRVFNDPSSVVLCPTKKGIVCYDASYYEKIKSGLNGTPSFPVNIDKLGRILITPDLNELYPISNSVEVSASKDGQSFIISSKKAKNTKNSSKKKIK